MNFVLPAQLARLTGHATWSLRVASAWWTKRQYAGTLKCADIMEWRFVPSVLFCLVCFCTRLEGQTTPEALQEALAVSSDCIRSIGADWVRLLDSVLLSQEAAHMQELLRFAQAGGALAVKSLPFARRLKKFRDSVLRAGEGISWKYSKQHLRLNATGAFFFFGFSELLALKDCLSWSNDARDLAALGE